MPSVHNAVTGNRCCYRKELMNQRLAFRFASTLDAIFSAATVESATCESLASMNLPQTTITAASTVAAGDFTRPGPPAPASDLARFQKLPAFCRVQGVIRPSSDSHIEFEVWLPSSGWNGKYLGVGNGGFAGSIRYVSGPGNTGADMAAALAGGIGERLAQHPGAALFVDYGYFPSAPGPTLAAVRHHDVAAVLEQPGTADLSAHVDFATFGAAASAAGATVYGPATQGAFLTALGAEARLASLSARATEPQREARRWSPPLDDPGEMGNLFKVMAFLSPGLAGAAGKRRFRPWDHN